MSEGGINFKFSVLILFCCNFGQGDMDPMEILHEISLGGKFNFDGYSLNYVRDRNALSHIERDNLSLPELRGFLGDHVNLAAQDVVDFHWPPPELI